MAGLHIISKYKNIWRKILLQKETHIIKIFRICNTGQILNALWSYSLRYNPLKKKLIIRKFILIKTEVTFCMFLLEQIKKCIIVFNIIPRFLIQYLQIFLFVLRYIVRVLYNWTCKRSYILKIQYCCSFFVLILTQNSEISFNLRIFYFQILWIFDNK